MSDSLAGAAALVTGATAGIGWHVAAALASRGARVFVTGRDEQRGLRAVAELRRHAGHDGVELIVSDGSSVPANLALADAVASRAVRLDVLVNNVGGVFNARRETADGLEATLATNFAGPFALTTRLLPSLERSDRGVVVNVVSSAFAMWHGDPFQDLSAVRRYVGIDAHARAKLLNLLFTLALARRYADAGIVANAVNPGMAWTPGAAQLTPDAVPHWRWVWPAVRWIQRRASAEHAARGPVRLATSPPASGRYFDEMTEKRLPAHVLDVASQDRAWDLGARLVDQGGRYERQ